MRAQNERRTWRPRNHPSRDLAAEAAEHSEVRQTFVRHALTRLPLVGAFVITLNLFVQVRGDVGLAVAVAQNLTFGAIAVIVLLNLVIYLILGFMVASMPLVFDNQYNRWTRLVGSTVLVLLAVVLGYTASWLLLLGLFAVFVVTGVVVLHARRKPAVPVTRESVVGVLTLQTPPVDSELRTLWAEGRAMLRATAQPGTVHLREGRSQAPDARQQSGPQPALTAVEASLAVAAEPKLLGTVADEWNARALQIRNPRTKSVNRLAFAGMVGFVALFGISVLTQPIRFAPLELVSIKGGVPETGFVLLQGGRGMFVPDAFGTAQFITADEITSVTLCDDTVTWWSQSIIEVLDPQKLSGVDCTGL